MVLKFNSFDLETGYDYLKIYDCKDPSSPLLLSQTGSLRPDSVVATSGNAHLVFTSDYSIVRQGFEIQYYNVVSNTAPQVNFSISNTLAGYNTPILFRSNSSTDTRFGRWIADDGRTVSGLSASLAFTTSGIHHITFVGSNCGMSSSVAKSFWVQSPGSIEYLNTTLLGVLQSGGNMLQTFTISNHAVGDVSLWVPLTSVPEVSSSMKYYNTSGASTLHTFTGITAQDPELLLKVTVNGDFDSSLEYADVYVNDRFLARISDSNPNNGTDIVQEILLNGSTLSGMVLESGVFAVQIINSAEVNVDIGGNDLHKVDLFVTKPSWVKPSESTSPVVKGNSTLKYTLKFDATKLPKGMYYYPLSITSSDMNLPMQVVHCLLTVSGNPIADFGSSTRTIYTNNNVSFKDRSINTPTGWNWSFSGGTPSSSTLQHPTVKYASPGVYPVQLDVTNSEGSDSKLVQGYITVVSSMITHMSPNPSTHQSYVYITGSGLNFFTQASFRGVTGTLAGYYYSNSGDFAMVYVPQCAISGPITFNGAYGMVVSPTLNISATGPLVTSFSQNPVSQGSYLYLYCSNLSNVCSLRYRTSGGNAQLTSFYNSGSSLYFTVPYNAVSGPLTLVGAFGNYQTANLNITPNLSYLCMTAIGGGSLSFDATSRSTHAPSGSARYYTFQGKANFAYRISTCGTTSGTALRIYNTNGSQVYSNFGFGPQGYSSNASLKWNCTVNDQYTLLVTDYYCSTLSKNTTINYQETVILTPSITGIYPSLGVRNNTTTIVGHSLDEIQLIAYRNTSGGVSYSIQIIHPRVRYCLYYRAILLQGCSRLLAHQAP